MSRSSGNPILGFRHDALFYAGVDSFVDRTVPFIRAGVRAEEPMLVVVAAEKIDRLRSELGSDAAKVRFEDMAEVGLNPARIIPVWRAFVDEHTASGGSVRGVGEPIWASRSADELVECERHEALLNLAISEDTPLWLACPYDAGALSSSVLEEAQRNHPYLVDGGDRRASDRFRGLEEIAEPFDHPLPEPVVRADELPFELGDLRAVRAFTAREASAAGLSPDRTKDLVLAADEAAANSVSHGGGRGVLRIWMNEDSLVCEIRDSGRIDDPLAGRRRPTWSMRSGFGLWLMNQLCDLVQIRSFATGSVTRLHMSRR